MVSRWTVVSVLIGLLWACSALPLPAAEMTLHSLRSVYKSEKRKIERVYEQAQSEAGARYVKDLNAVIRFMEKAGDDFGVRPARAELARFERDKTVPKSSVLGTPELIAKARDRYHEAMAPADKEMNERVRVLATKYVDRLIALKEQLRNRSKTREAQAVQSEIDSISSVSGGGTASSPRKGGGAQLVLPRTYARDLALVYAPGRADAGQVTDLSGHKQHGRLIVGRPAENGDGGCAFTRFGDVIETDPLRMGGYWTVVVDARFPLGGGGKQRVLLSGGFRQDHVVVDQSGMLGTGPEQFTGCGYNVNGLKGWHRIAAVGQWSKTVFYVDGKRVGVAQGICREDLKAVGNSAGSGSPWSGPIKTVFVWKRVLTDGEIAGLPKGL